MTYYPRFVSTALALLCLACTSAREPDTVQAEAETRDEPATPPSDPSDPQGYCCDCNSMVGKALDCTPATADSCIGTTLAWCELDAGGTTSACEAKCDMVGWCCDCSGRPNIECWQTAEAACSYQWCRKGPLACANKCPPVACCDCTNNSCWPSDGLDCDAPHERWCVLEPNVDCFATCD